MFERRCRKTRPLLDLHGEWETGSFYPDRLMVAMEDGNIIRYRIDIMPKPQVGKTHGKIAGGYIQKENRPDD